MIFTIISPDKISLSMFCDFYRSIYLNGVKNEVIDLGYLYDATYQQHAYDSYKEQFKDGVVLVKYKIKSFTKLETLPEAVIKLSDHVIRFDLYSYEPIVVSSVDQNFLDAVLDRFRLNVKKLNGTP
jgi:hypothetical protein